jgi:hypothetical protein
MRRRGRARGACHGDRYRRRAVFLDDCIRYWGRDRPSEIPHLDRRGRKQNRLPGYREPLSMACITPKADQPSNGDCQTARVSNEETTPPKA